MSPREVPSPPPVLWPSGCVSFGCSGLRFGLSGARLSAQPQGHQTRAHDEHAHLASSVPNVPHEHGAIRIAAREERM